jgi:hypothetical protein
MKFGGHYVWFHADRFMGDILWLLLWYKVSSQTMTLKKNGLEHDDPVWRINGGFLSGWVVNALGTQSNADVFWFCSFLSFILFRTNEVFSPVIYAEIGVLVYSSEPVRDTCMSPLFPIAIRATATASLQCRKTVYSCCCTVCRCLNQHWRIQQCTIYFSSYLLSD